MDIRAILLIGGTSAKEAKSSERFGKIPLACLDVLGMSAEERAVRTLAAFRHLDLQPYCATLRLRHNRSCNALLSMREYIALHVRG